MEGVHVVPLDAFIQDLAGVAAPAGVDRDLVEGHLLDGDIRLFGHGSEDPVKEGLGVPVPPGARGKGEDLVGHAFMLGCTE